MSTARISAAPSIRASILAHAPGATENERAQRAQTKEYRETVSDDKNTQNHRRLSSTGMVLDMPYARGWSPNCLCRQVGEMPCTPSLTHAHQCRHIRWGTICLASHAARTEPSYRRGV